MKTPYELYGVECCSGWRSLYEPILEKIEEYNKDKAEDEKIRIIRVREKYGTLRFYVENSPQNILDEIRKAQHKSNIVCEECGYINPHRVSTSLVLGWYRTLCQRCKDKYENNEKEERNKKSV